MLLNNITDQFGSSYKMTTDGTHAIFVHDDPMCGDSSGHLYVNLESGGWFCHRCESCGYVNTEGFSPNIKESELKPFSAFHPISVDKDPRAVKYLQSRKVLRSVWREYAFSLSPIARYEGLILIPIHNEGYCGWQGRVYLGQSQVGLHRNLYPGQRPLVHAVPGNRWFSCRGFRRKNAIWNFDRAIQHNTIVICEGIFSALAVGPSAMATLGKAITEQQLNRIIRSGHRDAVIALDGDARLASLILGLKLTGYGINTRIAQFVGKEDPDSVSDIEDRITNAPSWRMCDLLEEMNRISKLPTRRIFK